MTQSERARSLPGCVRPSCRGTPERVRNSYVNIRFMVRRAHVLMYEFAGREDIPEH